MKHVLNVCYFTPKNNQIKQEILLTMASHTWDLMKKLEILFDTMSCDHFSTAFQDYQKFIDSQSQESPRVIKGLSGKSGPQNCLYGCSCGNYLSHSYRVW